MTKYYFLFCLSFFFLAIPVHAAVFETFNIVEDPYNGSLTTSDYPLQQIVPDVPGLVTGMIVRWTGAAGVPYSGIGDFQIWDRTASVGYTLSAGTGTTTAEHPFIQYTPTTNLIFDITHQYDVYVPNYNFARLSPQTTYTNSYNLDKGGSTPSGYHGALTTDAGYDIYLRFNIVSDYTTSISFTDTPSITCEFSAWQIDVVFSDDDLDLLNNNEYGITVTYGTSPEVQAYYDFVWNTGAQANTPSWTMIPKRTDLSPGYALYARAYLCDSIDQDECNFSIAGNEEHIIAVSDLWEFVVEDPLAPSGAVTCPDSGAVVFPGDSIPTATSTEWASNLTCDSADGFFESSMCHLFQFLFKPDPKTMQKFADLKTSVEHKPPFGYVSVYNEALSGLSSATSTTSTLSGAIALPLNELSAWNMWNTIKTALEWILYIALAFYVFTRFKNFSLHG